MAELGRSSFNDDVQLITSKLQQLTTSTPDRFHRNLKALGYITYLCEKHSIQPILVGGSAVELYTVGEYTTYDVDLVLSGWEKASQLLEEIGFEKTAKHWYHETLQLPIEIPDSVLAGSMEKVIRIQTEENFHFYVIGIEDIILDRARAAVYWNSKRDEEWVLLLMGAQFDKIDFDYLERTAQQEPGKEVHDLLTKLKQDASK